MEPFIIGDIWYGKDQTPYAGVTARIDAITTRNVQITFDRTVSVEDLLLSGSVRGHGINQGKLYAKAKSLDFTGLFI